MTEIQNFYKGTTIFLTGGTGYLGKLVLEKLLRSCPEVKKIFILIREKRNKNVDDRFNEIFKEPMWDLLRKSNPNFGVKIEMVVGNCMEKNLALSYENIAKITQEVDIIMHCAATVRFDEELTRATKINVRAVMDLVEIAKKMTKLKALVHVSTSYCNCNIKCVDESIYEPPMDPKKLIAIVENLEKPPSESLVTNILGKFPNTYTFTKLLGENVIKTEAKQLPVAIVRPSIIGGTYNEPLPGYIDKPFGFTGLIHGIYYGLIRCIFAAPEALVDVVPGDYVANNIIAAAWYTSQFHTKNHNLHVYHSTSSFHKGISVQGYVEQSAILSKTKYPSTKTIWWPFCFVATTKMTYFSSFFLLHTLPAYIIYLFTFSDRMLRLFVRLKALTLVVSYFMSNEWNFRNENCQFLFKQMSLDDRVLFNFNVNDIDWELFMERQVIGIRQFLANESEEEWSKAGFKHLGKLWKYQQVVLIGIVACFLVFGALLLRFIF